MNGEQAKTIVEIATPLIIGYLDGYVKPIISEKISSKRKENYNANFLAPYYARSIEKFYFMRTIALGDSSHSLDDLYVPLSLVPFSRNMPSYTIEGFPIEMINDQKRLLIRDTAGMGKSTLTKYIFLKCLAAKNHIPIYIELRRVRENESLFDFIKRDMADSETPLTTLQLNDIYRSGKMLIILDGYDEISSSIKMRITEEINELVAKYKTAKFIITSRDDSALPSFGGFKAYKVEKLSYEDACLLLHKYGQASDKNIHEQIIEQIERLRDANFITLLENPLMVSLLFRAYDYKNKIPISKSAFYAQVYDALFEGHDLSKDGFERERKTKLDKFAFEDILKHISLVSLKNGPNYDEESLRQIVAECIKKEVHLNFTVSDFLKDVTWSIPLMIEDGNEIRWGHKSFQEYFASRQICNLDKINREKIIESMFNGRNSLNYANVIEMCLSQDRALVLRTIILPYIEGLYANYLTSKQIYPWLTGNDLILRSAATYNSAYKFQTSNNSSRERNSLAEVSAILAAASGHNNHSRTNVVTIGLSNQMGKTRHTVQCWYKVDQRNWIAEVIERNEIFKGIDNFIGRWSHRGVRLDDGARLDVVIPAQSTTDAEMDSTHTKDINSLINLLYNHFGAGRYHFINPEACPEIIAAIKISLSDSETDDLDFS